MAPHLPLEKRHSSGRPFIGRLGLLVAALLVSGVWCVQALAQTDTAAAENAVVAAPAPAAAAPASVAAAPAAPPIDTGSTAWMLVSSALVLFMVPGLALFYGGMVRAKNVLNMFLCCMVAIGVLGLIWVIYGYAVAFPVVTADTSLIGFGAGTEAEPISSWLAFDKSLLFLNAISADYGRPLYSGDTVGSAPAGVPELAFVMFQGKFFIITPALIVGAVAERIRFGPFILFMVIWSTIVYLPVAHVGSPGTELEFAL